MIRFLVDAQLPPRLARSLAAEGYQAEHVEDLGMCHAKDEAIWQYAKERQAVLVSKDEDFVERTRSQGGGPVVVWLRIGNSSNAGLLKWLLPMLPQIVARIQSGDRLIEIR